MRTAQPQDADARYDGRPRARAFSDFAFVVFAARVLVLLGVEVDAREA